MASSAAASPSPSALSAATAPSRFAAAAQRPLATSSAAAAATATRTTALPHSGAAAWPYTIALHAASVVAAKPSHQPAAVCVLSAITRANVRQSESTSDLSSAYGGRPVNLKL